MLELGFDGSVELFIDLRGGCYILEADERPKMPTAECDLEDSLSIDQLNTPLLFEMGEGQRQDRRRLEWDKPIRRSISFGGEATQNLKNAIVDSRSIYPLDGIPYFLYGSKER